MKIINRELKTDLPLEKSEYENQIRLICERYRCGGEDDESECPALDYYDEQDRANAMTLMFCRGAMLN